MQRSNECNGEVLLEAAALKSADSYRKSDVLMAHESVAAARKTEASTLEFAALYERYKRRVYGTVLHIVGQGDEVEDVVQNVFLQIHRSLGRYKGQSLLSTWIYRISVNVALQHVRKRKRRRLFIRFMPGDYESESSGVDIRYQNDTREVLRGLYQALDKLSEKKRTVFVLYELDGLPLDVISDICQIPVNTVRSRLHAARTELTNHLKQAGLLEGYRGRG